MKIARICALAALTGIMLATALMPTPASAQYRHHMRRHAHMRRVMRHHHWVWIKI